MESNFQRARGRFERKRKSFDDAREVRRRSRSPPRWERGKKQQKKTQTDVPPERELFVGNIPSNIDERFLLNFLNGAMRHANLCPRYDTPCLSCQINSGNFAFVEMLNAEMANRCLNLNGVLFLNARLKVGRPKKYVGPFVVTKTWQELTGEALTVDAVLDSEQEKVNRELFVGNTTPEMTDQMLIDYLGSAMEQVGLNVMEGNPITACEMFGKYAFIELRTPREATNALNLNNIPFMGSNLQVTRPSKWQGKWDKHGNWEHILAKHNMKPEEFQLGQIISPAVIAATPTEPVDGENINVVKAELAQVKRALEITRRQLDESNKKSEARKEQLVSLNKKWAEGKSELTERKVELSKVREELKHKRNGAHDMDTRIEAHELKKKHEETQGMLRGVTESLVKATEALANERKVRKNLERMFNSTPNLEEGEEREEKRGAEALHMSIDFGSLRAEMDEMKTEPIEDVTPAASTTPTAAAGAAGASLTVETNVATPGDVPMKTPKTENDDDEPKLDSLKEFLAKTPKTPIDWSAGAKMAGETPRSRDRGGVRICRLLVHAPDMDKKVGDEVKNMAGKYNLGGYMRIGKPGLIVVEGLEFNCDIFMDNITRQKTKFTKAGKVSERAGRAFPMELAPLEGGSSLDDFKKACESVGLTESLDKALNK